jgi:hypothetical protein
VIVNVTVNVPAVVYVFGKVTPAPIVPSPKFQANVIMLADEVELEPSNVATTPTLGLAGLTVNEATVLAPTTITVDAPPGAPLESVARAVTVNVPELV